MQFYIIDRPFKCLLLSLALVVSVDRITKQGNCKLERVAHCQCICTSYTEIVNVLKGPPTCIDSEDDEYEPVRKIRRCQRGTSMFPSFLLCIKESITNKCKNIWSWISELPLKDYFKETMYKKTWMDTNPTDLGIDENEEEENVIEVEDEADEDEEIAIVYDTSEISPPSSPSHSDRQEPFGNPTDTSPRKLSKSKPSEAASSKRPFNGSNPVSSSTPCVRENRQRMDVASYFPAHAKVVPEDDSSDLEIMSEVVHRVRKSPQLPTSKLSRSQRNCSATTNGSSVNETLSNSAFENGHSFTAHEVVRLQEKAKYKLLLDKVVTESIYQPVVPRNKRQALEIDLTQDDEGPVVNSEHRKEYLLKPVSDFVNEFYRPSKLPSPYEKKKNSPSLEDKDIEILKVEPLPTYKRRPTTSSKFFSQGWIEELKMTISSETERHLQIIADEERKIERYRMRRDAKIAEENRIREELMNVMLPHVEVEREDEFPALTNEMNAVIDTALYDAPPHQVLSNINRVDIRQPDITTLNHLNWLNDTIINCYLTLIVERSKLDNFPSVYAFNSFFYTSLSTRGAQNVLRWTRKIDIFSYDILFIPLHLLNGMHWALGVIDNRSKKISYYDSMVGQDNNCLNLLQRYIVAEMKDKKKIDIDPDTYSTENPKDIPQQMNGSDCGMFTLKYAEYISRDAPITFTQSHMPYFRRKMIYELLTNQLI